MKQTFQYIDLTYLNSIADNNMDIIKELIEIFIDQVPEFTDGLIKSFSQNDWNQVAAIAHKAKSSVISMGMNETGNNDLKNLELLAKMKRIKVLESMPLRDEKTNEELRKLMSNLHGYPEDRIKWVTENDKEDTIKEIIDKFVTTCEHAVQELNMVLEN
jgi:HPt (histidine-containing phosphotransfer) domain-containing protein